MTLLVAGYVATDVWLYAFDRMSLTDIFLLDVPVTMGFVILGAITYSVTGGDDNPT